MQRCKLVKLTQIKMYIGNLGVKIAKCEFSVFEVQYATQANYQIKREAIVTEWNSTGVLTHITNHFIKVIVSISLISMGCKTECLLRGNYSGLCRT